MQLFKIRPPSHSWPPWFLLQGSSWLCNACFRGHTLRLRMNYQLIPKELRPIPEKIEARQRLSEGDALTLYRATELNAHGMIANLSRARNDRNYATHRHISTI